MSAAAVAHLAAPTPEQRLEYALAAIDNGHVVVPAEITWDSAGDKKCSFHDSSWIRLATRAEVAQHWSMYPDDFPAVVTGALVLVDLDDDLAAAWWTEHGEPGYALPSISGRRHQYFRAHPDRPVKGTSGELFPKLDTRGVGGIAFVGGAVPPLTALPEAPAILPRHGTTKSRGGEAVEVAVVEPDGPFAQFSDRRFTMAQAVEYLAEPFRALETASRGLINRRLHEAALQAGHFVGAFWPEDEVREGLIQAQRRAWVASGGPDDGDYRAAKATIKSGFEHAKREPYVLVPDAIDRPELPPEVLAAPTLDPAQVPAGISPDAAAEAHAAYRRAVAEEAWKLRVREQARREVADEFTPPVPSPDRLDSLLAEDDEPVAYRVQDLLPVNGRVILAAQRKAGKTTTVGNLVRCLADGGPFLGRFEVDPPERRTVVLDFEMSRGMLRSWLRDQDLERPERVTVWALRGKASTFNIIDPATRSAWAKRLAAQGADFVVLDCLRPVLDAIGLSEDKEAGRFLVAFDALLAEAGVGEAVVVHHAGHGAERSRGDSRLRDWPDVEWVLVREDPEDGREAEADAMRYFRAEGRDVAVPEGLLTFDARTRRLELAGGNRKATKGERWMPALLEVVSSPAPIGSLGWTKRAAETALMERYDAPRAGARAAVDGAEKGGRIKVVKAGTAHLLVPGLPGLQIPAQSISPISPDLAAARRRKLAVSPIGASGERTHSSQDQKSGEIGEKDRPSWDVS